MPRGPRPRKLDDKERAEFLRLVSMGFGIHMALEQLAIGWARFHRERTKNKSFREDLKHAIARRDERLISLRYSQALEGDGRALDYMISRIDRAAELRRAYAERRRERERGEQGEIDLHILATEARKRAEARRASRDADGSAGGLP